MMSPLIIWFVAYVVPALCADILIALFPEHRGLRLRSAAIMHIALLISALASQYALSQAGLSFPWGASASIGLWIVAALLGYTLVGRLGAGYCVSALIQELAMLGVASLLFATYPLVTVILLIVPVFVLSHPLRARHWVTRLLLITVWGVASVCLFYVLQNFWIVAALHAVLGAFFIRQGILYPRPRRLRQ